MAKKKPEEQQPRALSPVLPVQTGLYKGGVYLELQKFKDSHKARQLLLTEHPELRELEAQLLEAEIDVTGLDLSVSEDKALHALQLLLSRTGYRGNVPGEEVHSESFRYRGPLPRLSLTYSDFFEAYGLKRMGDGSYHGHQAAEALKALEALEKPRRIVYERRHWKGKGKGRKPVYDVIVVNSPLILMIKGYKDLEEEEAELVKAGQDLPGRVTKLQVEFSPIFVDNIETFYLLKPAGLHTEIAAVLGARRISRTPSLFIEWLLTLNLPTLRISKEKLAERLRLDRLIKERHRDRLEVRLLEAFNVAKKLGYLLDYREDEYGLLIFTLNPERCRRIGQPGPEGGGT